MVPVRWVRLAGVILFGGGLAWGRAALAASAVEELTRRMPDGVLAFVGTGGGDALKDAFGKTLLGEIWNDQGVRAFCRSLGKSP